MSGLKIDLTGRTAIVTGASGGIGAEIALRLNAAGAAVALHYHRQKPDALVERIMSAGGKCVAVRADLRTSGFEIALLEDVKSALGQVDILVNCAADQSVGSLSEMGGEEFESLMQTNVSSVFALSRAFANQVVDNSAIINISSIEAKRPALGHGAYATSKAALEMLTCAMALEFGGNGLRVNAIAPGLIRRDGIEIDWPDGVHRWEQTCPLGRMGTAGDIADGALFLASDLAKFINGTVLTIDGGMGVTPGW